VSVGTVTVNISNASSLTLAMSGMSSGGVGVSIAGKVTLE